MPDLPLLVDAFVQKINSQPREPEPIDEVLLEAGFLQIGNPFFYNYDPVCFDCKSPRIEKRIVQLDHEAILQHGEMNVVKEVAASFVDFVHAALR